MTPNSIISSTSAERTTFGMLPNSSDTSSCSAVKPTSSVEHLSGRQTLAGMWVGKLDKFTISLLTGSWRSTFSTVSNFSSASSIATMDASRSRISPSAASIHFDTVSGLSRGATVTLSTSSSPSSSPPPSPSPSPGTGAAATAPAPWSPAAFALFCSMCSFFVCADICFVSTAICLAWSSRVFAKSVRICLSDFSDTKSRRAAVWQDRLKNRSSSNPKRTEQNMVAGPQVSSRTSTKQTTGAGVDGAGGKEK
mmetsp:Transcript_28580/g.72438  ORF Transcript_28580/g.72438 Transcript_28580/m.72438 type:complete len:252 (+) Transcript_28580:235-990(+)